MWVARMTVDVLDLKSLPGTVLAPTDICDGWCYSNFNTRVALLCQFSLSLCQWTSRMRGFGVANLEELVELGVEDTVSDELSLLGDWGLCGCHVVGTVRRSSCARRRSL